jgi:hypothetical protein
VLSCVNGDNKYDEVLFGSINGSDPRRVVILEAIAL